MSVNTAHANNGVLIHAGEYILLHSDAVSMEFSASDNHVFSGAKKGRIYLTSHRMIFNNKKPDDDMQSFSAPFIAMSDVELEQPVFGANYIKGKVRAQPNGNFVGEVKFKLYFKAGGAIEYGQALLRAASTAQSNMHRGANAGQFRDDPPPYTPSGAWHEAPPPAYQPPPGYYGWLPTHDAFSGPAPNTVFVSDNPPPYPGIGGPPPYQWQPAPYPAPHCTPQQPHPQQPAASAPQPQQQYNNNQPSWNGFSLPPDMAQSPQNPAPQGGAASWGGFQQPGGYAAPGAGYAAPGAGYGAPGFQQPGCGAPGYQPPPGYQQPGHQPQQPGYGGFVAPPGGQPPYNPGFQAGGGAAAGAMGFSAPPNF